MNRPDETLIQKWRVRNKMKAREINRYEEKDDKVEEEGELQYQTEEEKSRRGEAYR